MVNVSIDLSHIGTFTKTFLNHFSSSPTEDRVTNYDSINEWAKHVWVLDFEEIASPVKVKIQVVTDLNSQ